MAKAPLALSSSQQAAILRAAYALPPADRNTFTAQVRERLEDAPELGDGVVWRACRAAQRELFQPPLAAATRGTHRAQPLRKLR